MTTTPHSAPGGRHSAPSGPYVDPSAATERIVIPAQFQQAPVGHLVPRGHAPVAPLGPSGLAMKRRHPIAVWLGLPLITFGIYTLVWYYKIHREMAEFDRRRAVPVAGPMLVLLFLSWTFVAPLVSFFNTGNRIANAQRAAGLPATCSPWVGLLLCFVFGLQTVYYQVELNKIVDSYGVPAGTEIALRA